MNTQSLSANQAYEIFVGVVSPQEFVAPFGGDIDAAIGQLMTERWWQSDASGTAAHENLPELIREYVEKILDS